MALIIESSPHINKAGTQNAGTGAFMREVILATVPGILCLFYFFGFGVLFNIVIAISSAILFEAAVLRIRKKNVRLYLSDLSAVVTASLLALALPPLTPWWMTVLGTGFAIVFAKHLYGGLGSNPFNPAMVAYVLLLISYPVQMTTWLPANNDLSFLESFKIICLLDYNLVDGLSGATPLDEFKSKLSQGFIRSEFIEGETFNGAFAAPGWEWVNLAFLIGGIYLYNRKIINWHIPFAFLSGIFLPACVFFLFDPDRYATPLFHLLSGGTMLGAFFIATDPVTAASSNKGRFIYGFGIGILIYIIRTWGGYPDAVAFAVLLFNLSAPTIDNYTLPRAYGYKQNFKKENKNNEK